MRNLGICIIPVLLGAILTNCGLANKENTKQIKKNQEVIGKANEHHNKLVKTGFSGAILDSYKGEKLFPKGHEKSDIDNTILNLPNTVLGISSITKQFTSSGIFKLEIPSILPVNDTISEYLPNIPSDKSDITLHHILTHSSGLVDRLGDECKIIF